MDQIDHTAWRASGGVWGVPGPWYAWSTKHRAHERSAERPNRRGVHVAVVLVKHGARHPHEHRAVEASARRVAPVQQARQRAQRPDSDHTRGLMHKARRVFELDAGKVAAPRRAHARAVQEKRDAFGAPAELFQTVPHRHDEVEQKVRRLPAASVPWHRRQYAQRRRVTLDEVCKMHTVRRLHNETFVRGHPVGRQPHRLWPRRWAV
eukprot:scaffold105511_cov93-Phaeocystis_antarctica.AAC.4